MTILGSEWQSPAGETGGGRRRPPDHRALRTTWAACGDPRQRCDRPRDALCLWSVIGLITHRPRSRTVRGGLGRRRRNVGTLLLLSEPDMSTAQSGAFGGADWGQFIPNAPSSQGILYAMESHYVSRRQKTGGFALQVAARVVSKHLPWNVMAGHDDVVYALLSAGHTILPGSNSAGSRRSGGYLLPDLRAVPDPGGQRHGTSSPTATCSVRPCCRSRSCCASTSQRDPPAGSRARRWLQDVLFGAKGRVFGLTQYSNATATTSVRRTSQLIADSTTHRRSGRAGQRRTPDRPHLRFVPENCTANGVASGSTSSRRAPGNRCPPWSTSARADRRSRTSPTCGRGR